ncbi:alpha/beta hydrolase [Nitrogeniibacter mangrovi]|uniref:Alpha/beta hydrolase n=1 Tax=Nitrogeniibacter mangrovi TaxID=2016596 RepID=A0A6C1B8S7_9RHOO|nr:alpha/beta hydrolase [Nitrogeniibacter mangrovi]QID19138.1 alpha/beta hydrolase [Nitrogeniibacter mangrovi]
MKPMLHLIPGTMCTARLWSAVAERLADTVDLVHVPIPQAPDLAATVAALRAHIGEDGANVAGFSLGAYLAASLAVRHPGAVGRLMLISNTPCPLSAAEQRQRAAILDWVERHGYTGISRAKAASLVDAGDARQEIIDTILAMDAELGEAVFVHQMRVTTERTDLAEPLGALGVPVDFVFSRADPMLDHAWLERFAHRCPRAHLHAVEGRGHMLPLEQPDAVVARLRRWLARAARID